MKGSLLLPFPLAGPREGPTWACSRPKVTQAQVLAAAEQASPCVGLSVHSAAHKLWLWKPGFPLQNTKNPKRTIVFKPNKHILFPPGHHGLTFLGLWMTFKPKSHGQGRMRAMPVAPLHLIPPHFLPSTRSQTLYPVHSIHPSLLWWLMTA